MFGQVWRGLEQGAVLPLKNRPQTHTCAALHPTLPVQTAAAAWRLKVARAWATNLQPWLEEFGQAKLLRDLEHTHPEQLSFLEHADLPAHHVGAWMPAAQQQQQQQQQPPVQQTQQRTPLAVQQAPQQQVHPPRAHSVPTQQAQQVQQQAQLVAPAQQHPQPGAQAPQHDVVDFTHSASPPATEPAAVAASAGQASGQQPPQALAHAQPPQPQQPRQPQQQPQAQPKLHGRTPTQPAAVQPRTPLRPAAQLQPHGVQVQGLPQLPATGQAVKAVLSAAELLRGAAPKQAQQQTQQQQLSLAGQPKASAPAGQRPAARPAQRPTVLPEE